MVPPPRMLAGCWQVNGFYLGIPQTSKSSKSPGGDEKIAFQDMTMPMWQ